MDEYLTVQDVAQVLHANVQSVRKWTRTGELRAAKVGTKLLVKPRDLEEFVDARIKKPLDFYHSSQKHEGGVPPRGGVH